MPEHHEKSLQATPEQIIYARILEKGMFFGLVILLITYAIYMLGILKPYIPLTEISKYWIMSVTDYLHQTNIHQGWSWVAMVHYGDFINFIGIALLAGVTIMCFLAVIPSLLRQKDKLYAGLALLEALILAFAASGILGSGGH